MTDPAHQPPGSPDEPPADAATRPVGPRDRLGTAAVALGAVGIVFFGIGIAIITALLAAEAGKQARAQRRSQDNAYLALALAFIDGVMWVFLQYRFDLPIWIG